MLLIAELADFLLENKDSKRKGGLAKYNNRCQGWQKPDGKDFNQPVDITLLTDYFSQLTVYTLNKKVSARKIIIQLEKPAI
jgi:hypothetical protein